MPTHGLLLRKNAPGHVADEAASVAWFTFRTHGEGSGLFQAFNGEPPPAQQPAAAESLEIVASKLPKSLDGVQLTCGLLLEFRAKHGNELKVEQFLRDAQTIVQEETDTVAWFALKWPDGRYGIFDVFPDHGARFAHITGHVPRELTKQAFTLLGGLPSMHMLELLASHVARRPTLVGLGVD